MKNFFNIFKSKLKGFKQEPLRKIFYKGISGNYYRKGYYKAKNGFIFDHTEARILDREASK